MSRNSTIATLALLLAISPFLGLPYTWLMWVVPALSLILFVLAYTARSKKLTPSESVSPTLHEPVVP